MSKNENVAIFSTDDQNNQWPQEWHVGVYGPSTATVFEPILRTLYTPKHQYICDILKCQL